MSAVATGTRAEGGGCAACHLLSHCLLANSLSRSFGTTTTHLVHAQVEEKDGNTSSGLAEVTQTFVLDVLETASAAINRKSKK